MTWRSDWVDIREEDIARVSRQLAAGTATVVSGGVLGRFENAFGAFAGAQYAVAMNSGTSALYAALFAVGVGPGDDVLMPDYAFHGAAAAVLALGARVVPCDVEARGLTFDPADLARAITKQTKAVLVHHPWGIPADLAAIRAATGLPIVSDASHAHGATLRGRPLAAWSDITCFSLGYGKLITGGELGCAVTDAPHLADRMMICGHVNRVPRDLEVVQWAGNAVGLKLRPHAVALTLALGQLPRFPEKARLIRATANAIELACERHGLSPLRPPEEAERAYWRVVLQLDPERWTGVETSQVEERLRAAGIPVEPCAYWPLLQNQSLFDWPGHESRILRRACPVAAAIAPRTITLPAPVRLEPETLCGLPGTIAAALSCVQRP
jgi:perosamine synthetase